MVNLAFPEMNRSTPTRSIPNASFTDTLSVMRQLAQKGKKDLEVRRLVERINANVAEGDYASEALAIYYWVKQNIRYMRDVDGVEFVKDPQRILKTGSGDCDDMATLLAAMLMSAGHPVRFAVASFRPQPMFSHVYVEVMTPHGPLVLDPVANRETGKMLGDIRIKKTFPVSGAGSRNDAGIGSLAAHVAPTGQGNLYSVFDYHRNMYDYFEAPYKKQIPATGQYRSPKRKHSKGIVPEDMAAPLPLGSKKIGTGNEPRGLIASRMSGVGDLVPNSKTLITLAIGAAVGVYVYEKYLGETMSWLR